MPRISMFYLRTAMLHLLAGFTFGALMLANKGLALSPMLWVLLQPHIEVMLTGWVLQLALGTALWILPRHTEEPRYGRLAYGWAAFWLLNTGVLLVVTGRLLAADGMTLVMIGRLSELMAVLCFAIQMWPRIKAFGVP